MVRETICGSTSRAKKPAKKMDAIDKACLEIHDGSTTDELFKILLNLSFHSAITSAIEGLYF